MPRPQRKLTLYQRTAGGTWYAKWREPDTRRCRTRSLRTADRTEAGRRADAIARQLRLSPSEPVAQMMRATTLVLGAAIDEYLAHRRALRDARHEREILPARLSHLRRYLDAGLAVGDLTRLHLSDFWQRVATNGLAPATKRVVLEQTRRFCQWLVDQGYVAENPTTDFKLPPAPRRGEVRCFTSAEVRHAVEAARLYSPDGEGLVLITVCCGLRASEVCRLLWRDVELGGTDPQLRVESHTPDPQAGVIGATTKCESSRRNLPLEEPLLSWLREHREFGHGPYVFMHPPARGGTRSHLLGGLARVKNPQKLAELQQRLDAALAEEADRWRSTPRASWSAYGQWPRKLAVWIQKQTSVRWDCRVARHTFATMLVRRGEIEDRELRRRRALTMFDLQRLMGHASVTTTERCYLGHYPMRVKLDLATTLGLTPDGATTPTAGR